jgi:hypothetical protein
MTKRGTRFQIPDKTIVTLVGIAMLDDDEAPVVSVKGATGLQHVVQVKELTPEMDIHLKPLQDEIESLKKRIEVLEKPKESTNPLAKTGK